MVIGISGRLGSGKDTVGSIIQYLHTQNINPNTNSTIDNYSIEDFLENKQGCNALSHFKIKKFAGKLKLIGSILSGVPVENFEDQEFKKKTMSLDWIQPKHYNCENYDELDGGNCSYCSCKEKEMTYREFLQKLGTEAMRDGLHKEVWVNALFADYKWYTKEWDELGNETLNAYPNWIITDMRFPNELDAVQLREGITIRVNRDNGTREIDTNPHPSETALDDAKFDYVIENDGTLDELVEKVRAILILEKIIS